MKTSILQFKKKNNKGFVILFAILVSSLILLISAGIFRVVQKEVILSSSARESQRAFYAADSALECALYADLITFNSPPATPFIVNPPYGEGSGLPNAQDINCGGASIKIYYVGDTNDYDFAYTLRYYNNLDDTDALNNSCAYVLVEKNEKNTESVLVIETRLTAVGFNVCTTDNISSEFSGAPINIPDFDDPTLLERRLSISYDR